MHWRDYFKNILTSVNRHDTPNREIPHFSNDMTVNFYEVVKAIKFVGRCKSEGPNGVSAEHLIFADKHLYVYLSFLFVFMFRYSVVPYQKSLCMFL